MNHRTTKTHAFGMVSRRMLGCLLNIENGAKQLIVELR